MSTRFLRMQVLQRRQHYQNVRRRLFKAIFATQGQPQTLPETLAAVHSDTQEEALLPRMVEEMMKELALDLAGDMSVTEAATMQFAFPRITHELREVGQLRAQQRVDGTLGNIIADSH